MARHFGASPVRIESTRMMLYISLVVLVLFLVMAVILAVNSGDESGPDKGKVVSAPEPEMKKVEVLIPLDDIPAGESLEPRMFRKEIRPAVDVNDRVVRAFEEIANQYARTLIVKGQPLTLDYVVSIKPTTAISAAIPPGFRAVTIRVNATSSVEGWARAGSKVDVLWASQIQGQPGVTTIVQNAKILSAERNVSPDTPPGAAVPSTVTLLVSAEDSSKIQLASTTGSLSLSLRGDSDSGKADNPGSITIKDLYGGSDKTANPADGDTGTVTIGGRKYRVGKNGQLLPAAESR